MVRIIRWVSLASMLIVLYLMGRDSFHLKHTKEFFVLVFVLCFVLALVFALTRGAKEEG